MPYYIRDNFNGGKISGGLKNEGAIDAMNRLKDKYDIYILSTAPWDHPSAWSDKLEWVQRYLGEVCYKRLIL